MVVTDITYFSPGAADPRNGWMPPLGHFLAQCASSVRMTNSWDSFHQVLRADSNNMEGRSDNIPRSNTYFNHQKCGHITGTLPGDKHGLHV